MYCRVFFRIVASIASGSWERSMRSVRRGCTYTGERRTPAASSARASGSLSGTSGSMSRLTVQSRASSLRSALTASGRRSSSQSGPRGAYATDRDGATRLRSTWTQPRRPPSSSRTKRSARQPVLPALGTGHAGLLLRLFDVLALRVAGAPDERPEPAAALREWLAALRAHLALEDLELRLLLPLERLGVIAGTGGERLALL